MENASKALLIAGAILLAILIIAIGMFIYNSAQATVNDSLTSMTTQEVDAFNNQFVSYEQEQTGSNVKALIGRLIANANTYVEESAKVPHVLYVNNGSDSNGQKLTALGEINSTDNNNTNYVTQLGTFRNLIANKHKYYVEFEFGTSGVITKCIINYEDPNKVGNGTK